MSMIMNAPKVTHFFRFLADSIMADVIDYDEFLTGQRSEATYTMFKQFLPKIAAIPASAIPMVLVRPPIMLLIFHPSTHLYSCHG